MSRIMVLCLGLVIAGAWLSTDGHTGWGADPKERVNFAVGLWGSENDSGGTVGINPEYQRKRAHADLLQNQPNPSSLYTTIPFVLKKSGHVRLALYDPDGGLIGTLVNQHLMENTYYVRFSVSILPKGIYLYSLQTADYIYTRKMAIIK